MNLSSFRNVLVVVNTLSYKHNNIVKIPWTCCKFEQLRPFKADCVRPSLKKSRYSNGKTIICLSSSEENDIIKLLMTHLNCSSKDAELLYNDNHNFLLHNSTNIMDRIYILDQNGISHSTIVENFWILIYGKEELKSRLELLKKWEFTNPNNGVHILRLPMMKLIKYTTQTTREFKLLDSMNRITYFSSFVQCAEKRASQLFVKYNFMMSIKIESLMKLLTMIKDQGVLTEDLLSDLWVFRYSQNFISKRIKLLKQIGAKDKCDLIKPWMLRCTQGILFRYFELREENMAALGAHSDITDLLSNELGLPAAQVDEMILKHPPLANISYSKAKDMIEFLKAEGFSSKMIYHVPRVLCHKQATLVERMMELKRVSPNLINLQNLCRNRKDYVAFLNKMS